MLNCKEVKEAPNIVTLHVTSFPYALQTQHTLVSPYNEIHWPASYSDVSARAVEPTAPVTLGWERLCSVKI